MKTVRNYKAFYPSGHVAYFMQRTMPDGSPFRYSIHLSPSEQEQGRAYIARRLRTARANMRDSMNNLINAKSPLDRRRWARDE